MSMHGWLSETPQAWPCVQALTRLSAHLQHLSPSWPGAATASQVLAAPTVAPPSTPLRPASARQLWDLFVDFLGWSLLSIGGAVTLLPDMHRSLVQARGIIADKDFAAAFALAQAAPGPNVLFVASIGWRIGGLLGACLSMAGIMLPSTTLALAASRWVANRRQWPSVRAFRAGTVPVTLGLLLASGWQLLPDWHVQPRSWVLALVVAVLVWRTRVPLLVVVAGAGLVGGLGWLQA